MKLNDTVLTNGRVPLEQDGDWLHQGLTGTVLGIRYNATEEGEKLALVKFTGGATHEIPARYLEVVNDVTPPVREVVFQLAVSDAVELLWPVCGQKHPSDAEDVRVTYMEGAQGRVVQELTHGYRVLMHQIRPGTSGARETIFVPHGGAARVEP